MSSRAVYTHGHAESVLRSHRTRTAQNSAGYLLPHLRPGLDLLDIGSGPGTITADLVKLVAPGQVTAVEVNDAALAITGAELERRGCENVQLLVEDVHALQFPSNSFDVVHAHQVLQHVADPVTALREMIRVCRPGGVVAVRDADYGGFFWYPELPGLDQWRTAYKAASRVNGGEPDAGRRLLAWAHAAGARSETGTADAEAGTATGATTGTGAGIGAGATAGAGTGAGAGAGTGAGTGAARVTVSSSTWCYADSASRAAWGGMWADRITGSAITEQLLTSGLASPGDIETMAAAWRDWAADPDGWITIPHGELLIHVE